MMVFNLKTAQDYAMQGKLDDWVHAYLTTGDWQNMSFSDGLKRQQRWWIAPTKVSLDLLIRCCGPEPEMEYYVEQAHWDGKINKIANSLNDVAALPPLIIEDQNGVYSIRDGNHRHAAMRRRNWTACWIIIWYDSEAEWRESPYFSKTAISNISPNQ